MADISVTMNGMKFPNPFVLPDLGHERKSHQPFVRAYGVVSSAKR